jgi:hypothetical protein
MEIDPAKDLVDVEAEFGAELEVGHLPFVDLTPYPANLDPEELGDGLDVDEPRRVGEAKLFSHGGLLVLKFLSNGRG